MSEKLSLLNAADVLSSICDKIDTVEELDQVILHEFGDAQTMVAESIDRRKWVYRETNSKIALGREMINFLRRQIGTFEAVLDSLTRTTKQIVEAHPNQPFADSFGVKLRVQKNSQPALKLDVEVRDAKTVTNVIDQDQISFLEIPDEYVKTITYQTLDVAKLKEDLAQGTSLTWANLDWGTHLRGLK